MKMIIAATLVTLGLTIPTQVTASSLVESVVVGAVLGVYDKPHYYDKRPYYYHNNRYYYGGEWRNGSYFYNGKKIKGGHFYERGYYDHHRKEYDKRYKKPKHPNHKNGHYKHKKPKKVKGNQKGNK